MFTLYLSCLIFGGILLAVSIIMGGDGDFGGDVDVDVDVDLDADVDVEADGEGVLNAFKFFSFRNAIYFIAFFGLTGVTVSGLAMPAFVTLLAALFMGFFAATLGHLVMEFLKKSQVGQGENIENLEGHIAKVVLDITAIKAGKISIEMRDTIHQMLARIAEESAVQHFKNGENVIIIHVENGYAYVAEENFIA
ncbi:hypothetical protein KC799_05580 [candidate division KSB1 bacterium]|nr:hypothetical protein [candidate division KSB1 bacterium]